MFGLNVMKCYGKMLTFANVHARETLTILNIAAVKRLFCSLPFPEFFRSFSVVSARARVDLGKLWDILKKFET